jgi:lipopolysaccharide/colanic/teichoic acid biosynthesis glycosyltransferase
MDRKDTFYAKYRKRFFDLALIVPGFLLIFPLLAVVALLVRTKPDRPVLFRQQR